MYISLGEVHQDVDQKESIVRTVERSPLAVARRIARHLNVSQTRVWRTLHAKGMYPTPSAESATSRTYRFGSEAGILELTQ